MADSHWTVPDAFRYVVGPTIGQAASKTAHDDKSNTGSVASVMVAQAALRTDASSGTEPLLSVRAVSVRFGGIVALDGVSFDVAPARWPA